jgi:hypothetical protein
VLNQSNNNNSMGEVGRVQLFWGQPTGVIEYHASHDAFKAKQPEVKVCARTFSFASIVPCFFIHSLIHRRCHAMIIIV